MRLIVALVAALTVAGCATFDSIAKDVRSRYVGKPLSVAIAGLGIPDREATVSGRKVVTWEVKGELACSLLMEVGPDEVVTGSSIRGQLGACETFGG